MLGPIFVREWLTVPRRDRHYAVRAAYLGLLWVLSLTAWQVTVGWTETATLGDTARFGLLLFQVYTLAQLVLILFFSALSAASAVSQEKDRRTFVLLLMTDLRAHEIVVGKLLGSLLQIGLLMVGMVPVLALIMLLGGVSAAQVAQAAVVLAATALAAGSVGTLVALWREKTFQALALTTLVLVLYLCAVQGLAAVPALVGGAGGPSAGIAAASVQGWLDPFQALQSVLGPESEEAALVPAAYGFAGVMVVVSVALNAWGMARLRVWNPSGEPIMQRESAEDEEKDRAKAHAAPGPVRHVWANPILWREIRTRAYGRMPVLVKLSYGLAVALVCYYALAPLWTSAGKTEFFAAKGLVPVGILSVLLLSAQAVTAITTERDLGALDLLLVTDLSPHEFIFGKLLGILYNAKEYLLPPLVLAVVYACLGLLASPPGLHPELLTYKNVEAVVAVVGATVVLLAFATVLGVHIALRNDNSRLAVTTTLGSVFFLSAGTLICVFLIWINSRFELQWLSFMLFIALCIGGLWWVLNGDRPSTALTIAGWVCPLAVFYTVVNILVAKRVPGMPRVEESADPLIPFLVTAGAFGFTVGAMLVPLLSEFDVALGRTSGPGE